VLFATACLIPLIGVVLFFLDRSIQRNTDQIINSENTIAALTSQNMTGYMNGVVDTLDKIASRPEILSLNRDESPTTLALARDVRADVAGLLLVDATGTLVSTSGPSASLLSSIPSQLQQTIATGQPSASGIIQDTDEHAIIMISVPVTTMPDATTTSGQSDASATPEAAPTAIAETEATGQNVGALIAVINVSYLQDLVVPYARGRTEIAVVNKDGIVVATAGIQNDLTGFLDRERENISAGLEGDTGDFRTEDGSGNERLGVFSPIQSDVNTWAVIVTVPAPSAYAQSLITQSIILLIGAAVLILFVAVILGEFTARQMRTLAARASAIKQGNFNVNLEPVGSGEIGQLSEALADMSDQLARQMQGLEESHQERARQASQMRDLLRRTMRMQEDERRRIAGDIHDAVSPLITGALYQTRALEMTNGSTPEKVREEGLRAVDKLLEQASDELHGVIFDLRPPDLDDIGVVAAIEAFIQTIERAGLRCELDVVNEPGPLSPEVRLGIYRIVQEALHNVVRHANADEAAVRIESTADRLRVTIRDNGSGFDPELSRRPTSLGLLSMRERAVAIGATFRIVSKPGSGTAIIIERANTGSLLSEQVLADLMGPTPTSDASEITDEMPTIVPSEPVVANDDDSQESRST